MYMYIGQGTVLETENVIGIFDLDITSQSHITRAFLSYAEKKGAVVNASEDIPRSFLLSCESGSEKVYLCQPSTATLLRRAENGI
jgi:hypothetical protein